MYEQGNLKRVHRGFITLRVPWCSSNSDPKQRQAVDVDLIDGYLLV